MENREFITRILRPLMKSINHPAQMYPVGLQFGLGSDTATEITLVLTGSGAAAGLPWYAIDWIAAIDLGNVGLIVGRLFVVVGCGDRILRLPTTTWRLADPNDHTWQRQPECDHGREADTGARLVHQHRQCAATCHL